jgi:hypothetical protein
VQPRLPVVPDRNAVAQIPIQERLVAVLDQPPVHLTSKRHIGAGVADEHPGHGASRLSAPR